MTYKEIQDLVKMVVRLELAELKLRDGDFEISVRTKEYTKARSGQAPAAHPISMAPASSASTTEAATKPSIEALAPGDEKASKEESTNGLLEVKSPIVGTFYRSPAPDKPPFVKVGDTINAGDVVCIVEAMKLFNEIESEISGKIVKVLVEDATPVEYDQGLFLIDPKG
ncbi:MAG TPA: acetyl-CoA carboxylase biotin carboxyl carrier protein [Saprospiraceae bacterium]|nr:acetyl-CoA carboxylase biotin carboxyl carrier protein [Saprospiraceae bacterium]